MLRSLARPAGLALLLAGLAAPARATWSIVAVDPATGEVVIGAATCIANFDLIQWLPVVRVGEGGGVSQGLVDTGASLRQKIWNGLKAGDPPSTILDTLLLYGTQLPSRQFGIVDFANDPVTWSGESLGLAATGVVGIDAGVRYAIQGNVLAGDAVIASAERAFLLAEGDLVARVMAGMEAARAMGGDGRCSCTTFDPDGCGAPPADFEKSSHVAFLIASRIGDVDGNCIGSFGCANGEYWLVLQESGGFTDPDPVLVLEDQVAAWRRGMLGRPDGVLSTAQPLADALVADGATSTLVRVELVDIAGQPLPGGGASVTATSTAGLVTVGATVDHGDGTYTIPVTAGTTPGADTLEIVADDGVVAATLYPLPEVAVDPVADLHVGLDAVSASEGAAVPFVLNLGAGAAGHPYVLLGGASGTDPGVVVGGALVPLNPDHLTAATWSQGGGPFLPGSTGVLDVAGRAEAALVARGGVLDPLVGRRLDWVAVDLAHPIAVTGVVGFDVLP